MRIERLTKPGSLKEWLHDTFREGQDTVALDIETTGLERSDKIISCAVTGPTADWVAFFGPEILHELLDAPCGLRLVFHNASFDLKMLAWAGVSAHDRFDYMDTLLLSHLLDENGEHSLGALVLKYYGDNYKEEFWTKYKKAQDAPETELAEYNAKDVHYTRRLHDLFVTSLRTEAIPDTLVEHVHRLQASLLCTEISGIAVDSSYLMQKGVELKTRIANLVPKMRETVQAEIEAVECQLWIKEVEKRKTDAGRARVPRPEFSFDSPKQVQALLYDQLSLPVQCNQKTKKPSVDDDALVTLSELHPVAAMLREHRELQKIYGTYIEGVMGRIYRGRIFPSFNTAGTATGRISHSNPNMGNLPREGGIRGMFVPDPGFVFLSADFSQLEVCLSAHFTRDTNLLKIVLEGASQHDITANSLGIPRALAKTLNFGMQYGCSPYKVSKVLGVSLTEGQKAYDRYWETYSGQKLVMDECKRKVDNGEPIINPFGRRRRFEARQRQPWDSAYRQSWNALVQGTGSDCTSRAFYLTDRALKDRGIGKALFTVHDEIIVQVQKDRAQEAQEILLETMKKVGNEISLTVELKAEASGPMERWLD